MERNYPVLVVPEYIREYLENKHLSKRKYLPSEVKKPIKGIEIPKNYLPLIRRTLKITLLAFNLVAQLLIVDNLLWSKEYLFDGVIIVLNPSFFSYVFIRQKLVTSGSDWLKLPL